MYCILFAVISYRRCASRPACRPSCGALFHHLLIACLRCLPRLTHWARLCSRFSFCSRPFHSLRPACRLPCRLSYCSIVPPSRAVFSCRCAYRVIVSFSISSSHHLAVSYSSFCFRASFACLSVPLPVHRVAARLAHLIAASYRQFVSPPLISPTHVVLSCRPANSSIN